VGPGEIEWFRVVVPAELNAKSMSW